MGEFFLQIIRLLYSSVAFHNLGLAIIEIAVLSRLVFYPFIRQQIQYSKKMSELQPQLSELKEKHKGNQQALASAQMALFKEHGVSPAAGCLPSIVQLVVLFGLYSAIGTAITKEHMQTGFLIWNMAKPDAFKVSGLPFLLPGVLVLLAAATQFIQTKMMMGKPPVIRKDDKPAEKKEKTDFMSEFAEAQSSMIWMFPLLFLFWGTQWPAGLALYWSVSSLLAIVQQWRIAGWGGLEEYVLKLQKVTSLSK